MNNTPRNPLAPLAIAGAAALWALFLYALVALPARIPLNWNDDGSVGGYGSKYMLVILPISALAAMAIMARARAGGAQAMHLPFEIPDDRLDAAWAVSKRYLNIVEAVLTIGFALIEAALVDAAATTRLGFFPWAVAVFIGALMLSLVAMLVEIRRVAG